MKFYDWQLAPNPKRLRMFLVEKGITLPTEQVGGDGVKLRPEFIQKYPQATVPMLELDDGTCIGEAMAICRYLEELHPEPRLLGQDAKERAIVEMWERRAYDEGMVAAAEVFRNTHPAFVDRGVPGAAVAIPQIPALVERGRIRLDLFFDKFDRQLADNRFLAGPRFSVADITAWCSIDLAGFSSIGIPDRCKNLKRWQAEVAARPSAKA
ncbi:MAG: glutathione S-transferase family protein [Betaproteobacteria bacterium]|nr:glutathione S-transferase family protein [Betaproteobacteria bacterium]